MTPIYTRPMSTVRKTKADLIFGKHIGTILSFLVLDEVDRKKYGGNRGDDQRGDWSFLVRQHVTVGVNVENALELEVSAVLDNTVAERPVDVVDVVDPIIRSQVSSLASSVG